MKKVLAVLAASLLLVTAAAGVAAASVTEIVDHNFPDRNVTGRITYSKAGRCLNTTWHISGLAPGEEYQLKVYCDRYELRLAVCDDPWPGECPGGTERCYCGASHSWQHSFLVMDIVEADKEGRIHCYVRECRLDPGLYEEMGFMITWNYPDWDRAWTHATSTFRIR